jgi:hypothetical protein
MDLTESIARMEDVTVPLTETESLQIAALLKELNLLLVAAAGHHEYKGSEVASGYTGYQIAQFHAICSCGWRSAWLTLDECVPVWVCHVDQSLHHRR